MTKVKDIIRRLQIAVTETGAAAETEKVRGLTRAQAELTAATNASTRALERWEKKLVALHKRLNRK